MKKNILYSCMLMIALTIPNRQEAYFFSSVFASMVNTVTTQILTPIEIHTEKILTIIGTGVFTSIASTLAIKMWLKKVLVANKPISFKQFTEEFKKLGFETKNITLNLVDQKNTKLENLITFTSTCGGVAFGVVGMWGMYKILYPDAIATKKDLENVETNLTNKINNTATKTDLNNTKTELKTEINNVNKNLEKKIDDGNQKLEQKINNLETNIKTELKTDINNSESTVKQNINNVAQNLKNEIIVSNEKTSKEFSELKNKLEIQKKSIEDVLKKIDDLKKEIQKNNTDTSNNIDNLKKQNNQIQENVKIIGEKTTNEFSDVKKQLKLQNESIGEELKKIPEGNKIELEKQVEKINTQLKNLEKNNTSQPSNSNNLILNGNNQILIDAQNLISENNKKIEQWKKEIDKKLDNIEQNTFINFNRLNKNLEKIGSYLVNSLTTKTPPSPVYQKNYLSTNNIIYKPVIDKKNFKKFTKMPNINTLPPLSTPFEKSQYTPSNNSGFKLFDPKPLNFG